MGNQAARLTNNHMSDKALQEFFARRSRPLKKAESPKENEGIGFALGICAFRFVVGFFFFNPLMEFVNLSGMAHSVFLLSFNIFMDSLFILLLVRHYRFNWRDIGIKSVNPRKAVKLFIYGSVLLFVIKNFVAGFSKPPLFSWPKEDAVEILLLCASGPFLEELFYRGCLQAIFWRRLKSKVLAVVLASFCFSLNHSKMEKHEELDKLDRKVTYSLNFEVIPDGLVHGAFYFLSGNSIIVPTMLHAFANVLAISAAEKEGEPWFSFSYSRDSKK